MGTLSIKVSSGNLESYEALFLQLPEPVATPVERLELTFGDVTQVFPSAYCLLAAYLARSRDRVKRPLVTRRFGANPQSAKLERAMDAIGFLPAVLGDKPATAKAPGGVVPLLAIGKDSEPHAIAGKVLEAVLAVTQPTRDAKESLFVIITELVENVRRHAQDETPAFLCGQLSAQKRKLELCLADAGIGVKASLESGKDSDAVKRIQGGESALKLALEAGRTSKGQGNTGFGLAVCVGAARVNKGVFRLTSGDETLLISREGDKHRTHAPWHGTVVNLLFNLDKVGALAEVYRALPIAADEAQRFVPAAESVRSAAETLVALKGEGPYLGSRAAAAKVRATVHGAVRAGGIGAVDLDGVLAITPGYADECFGELYDALGESQFRSSVGIRNPSEAAKLLIEAVLEHRARPRDFSAPPPVRVVAAVKPAPAPPPVPAEAEATPEASGADGGDGEA